MIDTHCHLLPGLDDGPRSLQEAVGLAHRLRESGITRVLATPHYSARFPTDDRVAENVRDILAGKLAEAGIELTVDVAAEVSPDFAVSASIDRLHRRSVAARYVMAEVQPHCPPNYLNLVHERLSAAGLVPIFCHPERSPAVQRLPSLVDEVRRRGAVIQVVAPSLVGRSGRHVAQAAWSLVETGRADLVGSDAHGTSGRLPWLARAVDEIERQAGSEASRRLAYSNPALILAGSEPVRPALDRQVRRR